MSAVIDELVASCSRCSMRVLPALALCLAACPVPAEPECDVEPVELALPEQCWEDSRCVADTPAEEICGRAYACTVEGQLVCVTAWDCGCVDDVNEQCGLDAEMPRFCELREQ